MGFAAYAAVITVFCREENKAEGTFSATTAIAGMLTFALGAYAVVGDERIAAAAAVAAAGLLAIREELHGLVEKIIWPELRSGLLLLAMTFIALPIMPAEPIGPFGGVNPREVAHRHRSGLRVVHGLRRRQASRGKAWSAARCRGGRARIVDRCYGSERPSRGCQ